MSTPPARNGASGTSHAIAPMSYSAAPGTVTGALQVIEQSLVTLKAFRTFVKSELKQGIDFGKIPGCGDKAALFLAGAQKTAMFFNTRQVPDNLEKELGDGHLEVISTISLVSRETGEVLSIGVGSCCTLEKKYRYRKAQRTCPKCGSTAIIKGREDFGGGFLCFAKNGGCGAKYRDSDPEITGQVLGDVPNPDIYDVRNTVRKMAMKRGAVHAAMNLGCLSEMFTQDIEDTFDGEDFERFNQDQAANPEAVAMPVFGPRTSPARSSPLPPRSPSKGVTEVGVIGRDGVDWDERPLHEVVSKAAAAIDAKIYADATEQLGESAARKRHEPVTVEQILSHLVNRAIQARSVKSPKSFKIADMLSTLNTIYKSDRDWLRKEINAFGNDAILQAETSLAKAKSTLKDSPRPPGSPPSQEPGQPAPAATNTMTLAQAIPHEVTAAQAEFEKAFPRAQDGARRKLPMLADIKRTLLFWCAAKGLCVYSGPVMPSVEAGILNTLDESPSRDDVWQEMYRLVDTAKELAFTFARNERDGDPDDVDLPY